MGLERVARIVTAAAALISIVFLAFLASDITLMKAFGVGLPLAVLLDATLIRGALLPAAMRLGGRATWWAPGPLRRLHGRSGLRESTEDIPAPGSMCGPDRPPTGRASAPMARPDAFRLFRVDAAVLATAPDTSLMAWRLDRLGQATPVPLPGHRRPADSSDPHRRRHARVGRPAGGYSRDRSHGASSGPTTPGSRSPTIQGHSGHGDGGGGM
jgi:hypothetical protein